MPEPNLKMMLETVDGKLALSLASSRAAFQHATLRGDGAEYALRDSLGQHLPRNLTVGTGEVIDLSDTRTNQIDVIISNDSQPFRTSMHDSGLFLLEGIAAAGEVKARLTARRLQDTIAAASQFKKLRAINRGTSFYSMGSDDIRFLDRRPYFLFAFESGVSAKTLIKLLEDAPPVPPADGSGATVAPLDAVFILGKGVAINCGDGTGVLQYQHESGPQAGQPVTGWMWSAHDRGIFTYFLLWLSTVMPRIHRLMPIATDYLIRAIQ